MFGDFGITTILTGVLAIFSIIILGLTGYVANVLDSGSPDSNNFLIFCSVWSLLVVAYLLIANRLPFFNKWVPIAVLAVTVIFWFAGSIAAAAWLGAPSCHWSGCRSLQAAIAFSFFNWALFSGILILELLGMRGGGTTKTTAPGPAPYPQA